MNGLSGWLGLPLLTVVATTGCRFTFEQPEGDGVDAAVATTPQSEEEDTAAVADDASAPRSDATSTPELGRVAPVPPSEGSEGTEGASDTASPGETELEAQAVLGNSGNSGNQGGPADASPAAQDAGTGAPLTLGVDAGADETVPNETVPFDAGTFNLGRDAGVDASPPRPFDPCIDGTQLWYSLAPDASDLRPADGASLPSQSFLYVMVEPCESPGSVTEISFHFDAEEFQRTTPDTSMFGDEPDSDRPAFFNTLMLPAGDHEMVAVIERSGAPDQVVRAEVEIGDRTGDIVFGFQPNRSDFTTLDGATVGGEIFVTLVPEDATSDAIIVDIFLDDPDREDAIHTERAYPIDAAGGTATQAELLDTTELTNGRHVIEFAYRGGGSPPAQRAEFTVDN